MSVRGKVFVGQSLQELASSPDWGTYSKVILKTDDGTGYVAGDDTGLTLEADCPWATQAIANAVLAKLTNANFTYKPYNASTAYITPAAELGDGMTSDGFYSGIYSISRKFGKISAADLAAPCNTEVDHEFQYVSESDRKFVRKMQEFTAELAVKVDEVSSYVDGGGNKFEWSLKNDGMVWKSKGNVVMKINASGLEVTGTIKGGSVITGTLNVGGTDITATMLQGGARSGYSWTHDADYQDAYGNWRTGSSYSLTGGAYGFNYNSATDYNTNSFPATFKATQLAAVTGVVVGNTIATWQTRSIMTGLGSASTIYFLGSATAPT